MTKLLHPFLPRESKLSLKLVGTLFFGGLAFTVSADEAASEKAVAVDSAEAALESSDHPLKWTLRYANSRSKYIRENIRDYSCRLIKRERIDGELQKHQFIQVKVRSEQVGDDKVARPMAVFMHFQGPASLKGRQILYVEGQNNGDLLVRKGGRAFKYVKLRIDPNGTAARRESNYPITDIGFDKIIERLVDRVNHDIKNDPTAANTEVSHFRGAKVNDRTCTHIRVVHPVKGEGFDFHKASLYVDDKLNVPIRLTVHGWPEEEGDELPLIEEYTYVDLKLNVGLPDSEFNKSRLDLERDRDKKVSLSR